MLQGNIGIIWPLFGVSNQLLAATGLAIGTSFLFRHGRGRYAWVTMLPCIFMAVLTVMADYENVFNSYLPQGKYSLVVVSVVMFVLVAIVLAESVRSWIRLSKTVPQDYRTQDEIEEQTKKELEEAGKTVSAL